MFSFNLLGCVRVCFVSSLFHTCFFQSSNSTIDCFCSFYSGNLRIASRDQIARPVAQYSRSTAPAVAGPLREIPTMFCQSTSKKALDTFDRNMTRMYL